MLEAVDRHLFSTKAGALPGTTDVDAVAGTRLAQDHALVTQLQHRLIEVEEPRIAQRLGEEAGIHQVHHSVLGTTGIGINGGPVSLLRRIPGHRVSADGFTLTIVGAEVSVLIPGRADKGVHGVRLAGSRAAARRTRRVEETLVISERALTCGHEVDIIGQEHRQLFIGHRHRPARIAIDHRDGRSPIALPADQPITQTVVDRCFALTLACQPSSDLLTRLLTRRAAELLRVDHRAVLVMEEHILVERQVAEHLHTGPVVTDGRIDVFAARQDLGVGLHRVQLTDTVREDKGPPRANHLVPVVGQQMRLHQFDIPVDLGMTVQRDEQSFTGLTHRTTGGLDAGVVEQVGKPFVHGTGEHQALGETIYPLDHGNDGQPEPEGEGKVAFIMSRYPHDRTGPIPHHHVVGDPDRDASSIDRIDGIGAGEDARLLLLGAQALDLALPCGLNTIVVDGVIVSGLSDLLHERMFGRQDHKGGAPERVRACREDHQIAGIRCGPPRHVLRGHFERDLGALAASDPIGLEQANALGPVDLREIKKLVRVVRDLPEPLLEVLLDHL